MNDKFFTLLFPVLILTWLCLPFKESAFSAPAAPNESLVEGIVCEYAIISSELIGVKPQRTLYRLTIKIKSSGGIGGRPDFLHQEKGQNIRFLSRTPLSPDLFGKSIRAKARYSGDEKQGLYWISDIGILK